MHVDTPPPDDDALSDDLPAGVDDIEIIEDSEIEGYMMEEVIQIPDAAKVTFLGHSGSVFCCAFDKNAQNVVSGGEDDKAFIWNARTGTAVFECKGHKDSVIKAAFNHDSKFVATADMSGLIQVWDCSTYNSPVWDYDLHEDLKFLEWHHQKNTLFAGVEDGTCWLWELALEDSSEANIQIFQSNGSPCVCGRIMPNGTKTVVGYGDGSVRIWDVSSTLLHSIQGHAAHSDTVSVIDCHPDGNLIATGSIDGTAKLIKSNDGRVIGTMRCEPENVEAKSVEGIGFFTSQPLIAAGTICGNLTIWDIPTQIRRLQYEQQCGITQLVCDLSRPMVYTAGVDGVVRLFDGRTGQEEKSWGGHTAAVLWLTLSSDGSLILTASDDCSAKIFETAQR